MTNPAIILVEPQMGENIGAAARAMFNFGLSDLRLVKPRDGWPSARATAMASGALEKMPPVRVFDTLAEAIADLQFVLATTARPREMVRQVYTAAGAAEAFRKRDAERQKTGYVFGGERAGLNNDDIALCHGALTIPTGSEFSSINLGQSVLLVSYEWLKSGDDTLPRVLSTNGSPPVPHDKLEEFFARLEDELDKHHFFNTAEQKPPMVRNLRSLFVRGDLTEQEVRTLHGVISALTGKKLQQ
jgi:tRNA/rRNA methyltransferase